MENEPVTKSLPTLEQELAALTRRSLWQRGADFLFGYDFFISYRWEDGRHYAVPLAGELKRRGFDCFLDSENYAKGDNWKTVGAIALRQTSRLILVGSPGVLKSEPVLREVRIFYRSGRRIIPIDFGGTLNPQSIAQHPLGEFLTADVLRINEDRQLLDQGPSHGALEDIQRAFDNARQSVKRGRALKAVAITLALLLGATVVMWWQAVAARKEAERQTHLATAKELVLQSEKFLPRDPQLSLALAYYAAREATFAGSALPTDITALLQRTIRANPRLLRGPGAQAVAWSPDGTKLVAGSQDNKARIWDFATRRELGVLSGHTDWLEHVAWSPDGRLLATAAGDGTACVWDAASYTLVETIPSGRTTMQTVSFHPREPLLAVAHTSGLDGSPMMVQVWDFALHKERFHVPGFRAAFSPDGAMLATSDGAGWGVVQLFDMQGQALATMPGHERYVHALAWSPDSSRLATASVDGTVRVWDARKRTIIQVLSNAFALGVAWSPDGRYLASGGGERLVKLWNAGTLAEFASISTVMTLTGEPTRTGADDYILSIAWSPDGEWLAVADRGGVMRKGADVSVRIYPTKIFTAKTATDLFELVRQLVQPPSLDEVRKAIEGEAADPGEGIGE